MNFFATKSQLTLFISFIDSVGYCYNCCGVVTIHRQVAAIVVHLLVQVTLCLTPTVSVILRKSRKGHMLPLCLCVVTVWQTCFMCIALHKVEEKVTGVLGQFTEEI